MTAAAAAAAAAARIITITYHRLEPSPAMQMMLH
jgi:hypothetical protein